MWNWHKNGQRGPRNRTESPKIALRAWCQLLHRMEPETDSGERTVPSTNGAGKTGHHTPKNTELCLHQAQKAGFPHQALPLLSPLKTDTLSSQPRKGTFSPLFLTSFSISSSQKFLKRSAPVSVNWMPQSPKAEAAMGPEATELPLLSTCHPPRYPCPRVFLKPGWQQGLSPERSTSQSPSKSWGDWVPISCACARSVGRTCAPPVQGGRLCVPCQPIGKCRPSCPHSSVEALPREGSSAASIKLCKF